MTHTPGPWTLGKDVLSSVEEHMANANLIAAAPELLEALENWFEYADDHPVTCSCGRDKAKAAISKTKGEKQ
jgi:hypothetical protein